METRSAELLEANLDNLTEEELEAYLQSLEQVEEEEIRKVQELKDKIEGHDRNIVHLDHEIEEIDSQIAANQKIVAELKQERLDLINEVFGPTQVAVPEKKTRDSLSDEEKEKTKSSLSSNAKVSALLPPASVAQPLSPLKASPKQPSPASNPQQVSAAVASKASAQPQKEKSFLSKLGLNRNKSVPQQQAPAGSDSDATPVVTPQKNGLNNAVR
ncbi:MAG: hypothetical protein K0S27_1738 [Gammaproteobacteria bacterium]|jgi:hypothetical protein|nr:hypothetical protein [Gammaproteobacteria bacterium]